MLDERMMRLALREANRGAREGEVPVGAVLLRNGEILARAHNRPIHLHDPSAHAEILALRRAAKKLRNYRLEGCDLYVTIEPCAMCVGAIVHARLRRVIFGALEAKAGACGSALRVLNHRKLNHQVQVSKRHACCRLRPGHSGVLSGSQKEVVSFQSRVRGESLKANIRCWKSVAPNFRPRL